MLGVWLPSARERKMAFHTRAHARMACRMKCQGHPLIYRRHLHEGTTYIGETQPPPHHQEQREKRSGE